MENWGLVTYRTTAVLFDEKTSDARYKNRVAYVVAHELAHQWFGNLVTMDWWDELSFPEDENIDPRPPLTIVCVPSQHTSGG